MEGNARIALIAADIAKSYADKLAYRIADAFLEGRNNIYVGDCMEYAASCFEKYGLFPTPENIGHLYEIVQGIICLEARRLEMNYTATWSDDLRYIYLDTE